MGLEFESPAGHHVGAKDTLLRRFFFLWAPINCFGNEAAGQNSLQSM